MAYIDYIGAPIDNSNTAGLLNWLKQYWIHISGGAIAGYFLLKLLDKETLRSNPDKPYELIPLGKKLFAINIDDKTRGLIISKPEGWITKTEQGEEIDVLPTKAAAIEAIYTHHTGEKLEDKVEKADKKAKKAVKEAVKAQKAAEKAERELAKAKRKAPRIDDIILDMVKRSITKGRWQKYPLGHPQAGKRYRKTMPKEITAEEIAQRLAPFRRESVAELRELVVERGKALAKKKKLFARTTERKTTAAAIAPIRRKPTKRRPAAMPARIITRAPIRKQVMIFKSEGPGGEKGLYG
jgi:hypothetical protein